MNAASKSIYYFGFYLLILGITLTVYPNLILSNFGIAETSEVWIRVLGAIVFNIGLYYILMAPANHALFLMLTVYTRILVLLWFIVFVAIGWAPLPLIMFGMVDMAGAVWTYATLRQVK